MNFTVSKILLLIAVILLVFASFGFNPFGTVHLGWLGLAFFSGSFLVP